MRPIISLSTISAPDGDTHQQESDPPGNKVGNGNGELPRKFSKIHILYNGNPGQNFWIWKFDYKKSRASRRELLAHYNAHHWHTSCYKLPMPPEMHVVPREDVLPHDLAADCWCYPLRQAAKGAEYMDVLIHNAKDCRERFERQGYPVGQWAAVEVRQ